MPRSIGNFDFGYKKHACNSWACSDNSTKSGWSPSNGRLDLAGKGGLECGWIGARVDCWAQLDGGSAGGGVFGRRRGGGGGGEGGGVRWKMAGMFSTIKPPTPREKKAGPSRKGYRNGEKKRMRFYFLWRVKPPTPRKKKASPPRRGSRNCEKSSVCDSIFYGE